MAKAGSIICFIIFTVMTLNMISCAGVSIVSVWEMAAESTLDSTIWGVGLFYECYFNVTGTTYTINWKCSEGTGHVFELGKTTCGLLIAGMVVDAIMYGIALYEMCVAGDWKTAHKKPFRISTFVAQAIAAAFVIAALYNESTAVDEYLKSKKFYYSVMTTGFTLGIGAVIDVTLQLLFFSLTIRFRNNEERSQYQTLPQ